MIILEISDFIPIHFDFANLNMSMNANLLAFLDTLHLNKLNI